MPRESDPDFESQAPEEELEEPRVSGMAPRRQHLEEQRDAIAPPPEAPAHADHDDPLADAFFRHPDKPVIDVWEEPPPVHKMSRGSKRAMQASIAIFLVSTLGIASYSIYQNVIMPAPVELGVAAGEHPAVLPTPTALPEPVHHQPIEPTGAVEPVPPQPMAAGHEPQLAAAVEPQPIAANPQPVEAPTAEAEPTAAQLAVPADTLAAIAARPVTHGSVAAKAEGVAAAHLDQDNPERVAEAERSTGAVAATPDPLLSDEEVSPVRGAYGAGAGSPTYDELIAVGRALSKRNRRVEASEAFRRALLKAPHGSAALSGLGYVYLNADENQNARLYAQRAVQADATNAEGWIVLGAALEMLGDKPGAQDAYRNCVASGQGPYLLECRRVAR